MTPYQVVAFCASNPVGWRARWHHRTAFELGKALGEAGFHTVNGGGGGMMKSLRDGVRSADGYIVCIHLNQFPPEEQNAGDVIEGYTLLSERQFNLINKKQAFVALMGGTGTVYEIMQVIAHKAVGEIPVDRPMILIGRSWWILKFLLWWLRRFEGTIAYDIGHYFHVVPSVEGAMQILAEDAFRLQNPMTITETVQEEPRVTTG